MASETNVLNHLNSEIKNIHNEISASLFFLIFIITYI